MTSNSRNGEACTMAHSKLTRNLHVLYNDEAKVLRNVYEHGYSVKSQKPKSLAPSALLHGSSLRHRRQLCSQLVLYLATSCAYTRGFLRCGSGNDQNRGCSVFSFCFVIRFGLVMKLIIHSQPRTRSHCQTPSKGDVDTGWQLHQKPQSLRKVISLFEWKSLSTAGKLDRF